MECYIMNEKNDGKLKNNQGKEHKKVMHNNYLNVRDYERSDNITGLIPEHRLVMEDRIGRKLYKFETVHHSDRNKLNNSPNNLVLFRSMADHSRFHKYGFAILEDEKIESWSCPEAQFDKICVYCFKHFAAEKKSRKYCSEECLTLSKQKVKRPDKMYLKTLLYDYPIEEIAKRYKVSGNAIRKWLKAYGLPYKKAQIKEMRQERASLLRKKPLRAFKDYTDFPITMETNYFLNGNRRVKPIVKNFENIYKAAEYVKIQKMTPQTDLKKIRDGIIRALNGERKTYLKAKWYSEKWKPKRKSKPRKKKSNIDSIISEIEKCRKEYEGK